MTELIEIFKTDTTLLWAALVSAFVSAVTTYIFKVNENRKKVEIEYRYEQKKKLRELIGRYHGRLLQSANSLNYRFWNLRKHESEGWLRVSGNYKNAGYYFKSTVYRFLSVTTLLYELEQEAIVLDARIARKSDFVFLNYVALLHWVMTDVSLFDSLDYDPFDEKDHFFSDTFRQYSAINEIYEGAFSYRGFCENVLPNKDIEPVLKFFNSLCRGEDRFRWDRIIALHLVLLAFINRFGYKRQVSTQDQFNRIASYVENKVVLQNLVYWVAKHDLSRDKGAKRIEKASKYVQE